LPAAALPQRFLAWLGLLVRQFTPLGAMGACLGWIYLWHELRAFSVVSALALGILSLYAIGYDTADSLVYLVPAIQLICLWLGIGIAQATGWLGQRRRGGAIVVLLLPILQAFLSWGQVDLSDDRTATAWADNTLRQAPPQAIILTDQDSATFSLWYARDVLGQRPDVAVIDVDLWAQESYRQIIASELGFDTIDGTLSPEEMAGMGARPTIRATVDSDQVEK
jgi:hypothetical protein